MIARVMLFVTEDDGGTVLMQSVRDDLVIQTQQHTGTSTKAVVEENMARTMTKLEELIDEAKASIEQQSSDALDRWV